jgi:hypothetical protein
MAAVLTKASKVTCGHKGTVAVSSTAKLTVGGDPVLLKSNIEGATVSDCTTQPAPPPPGSVSSPCAIVTSITAGEATKLTVGGLAVILDTLTGGTSGIDKGEPQQKLAATAVQEKLTSV